MRPQIKQRWLYSNYPNGHYIAEIDSIINGSVSIKVVQKFSDDYSGVVPNGTRVSVGLNYAYAGVSNMLSNYWTYLAGQDSPE
jgi:hypothetical protein